MSITTTPPSRSADIQLIATATVSVLVMVLFLAALAVAYFAKDTTALDMLLGTIATMAVTVVGFWVGSSAGSQKKDATIAAQATAPAVPVAQPAAT